MFHRLLGSDLAAAPDNGSRLRYTSPLVPQRQAAVKLHGVFAFSWTVLDCAPVSQFHRLPGGDSGALVGPSCKSPIKRQGITLTSVAFRDPPIAGGGPRFLVTSPCRHGGRTVSSPLDRGDRHAVSEGSDLAIGLPCGLSAPRDCYRRSGTRVYTEFPANGRLLLRHAFGTLRGS